MLSFVSILLIVVVVLLWLLLSTFDIIITEYSQSVKDDLILILLCF